MYEYKKGFTLIEVLLVIVLTIAVFSMSLSILGSFREPKYIEKDFDSIKGILSQIKFLKISGEENINIGCFDGKITLSLLNKIIDEKQLDNLSCENQTSYEPFSLLVTVSQLNYKIKVNKYGYVSIERI